jgi:hypothetical protein
MEKVEYKIYVGFKDGVEKKIIVADYSKFEYPMVIVATVITKLTYGDKNSYKYQITEEQIKIIQKINNRKDHQINWLYQLVDGNFDNLIKLENIIKTLNFCPGDKKTVKRLLKKHKENV